MFSKLIFAALFICISLISSAQTPDFRLQDLDNHWRSYSEIKGDQLTVIDFWATWCQPCVRSLPLLNQIAEEYHSRGIQFIGINIDGSRNQSKIKPFVNSRGIIYPVLRDINSEVMADLNVTVVPSLLMFNNDGDLIFFHEGFRPGDEQLIRREIEKFLSE